MRKHRHIILDRRFHTSMVAKAQSSNPCEAEIGRQGQALRASCISSSLKEPNVESSEDTNISSSSQWGSSLKRQNTDITIPDTAEEMGKLLQRLPRWDPGSFARDPRCPKVPPHNGTVSTKLTRRCSTQSNPPNQQISDHEIHSRLWGGNYFIDGPKLMDTRAVPSWNERPLEEQKKMVKELREQDNFLNFPHWTKLKYKGRGKYRMPADMLPENVPQALIDRMGSTADLLGMCRGLPFEGLHGIHIDELLYIKYESEIDQMLQKPMEEIIGDTRVTRGFPVPYSQRLKALEAFLEPMTYATLEHQPYGPIQAHRIAHNYYLKGKDCDQKVPEEGDMVYAFPERLKDQASFPIPKSFTSKKLLGSVHGSCLRHPRIIDSDLEALPKHPTVLPKPRPIATEPAAMGRQPAVSTIRRVLAAGRPALERRTSDKGPKAKKTKASALGKRRVASAVQLTHFKEEKKPCNSCVVARTQDKGPIAQVPDLEARDVAAVDDANPGNETPDDKASENDPAWIDAEESVTSPLLSSLEDLDSPPLWLLATSKKEHEAQMRSLRPISDVPRRSSVKSSKQLLAILSKSPALTASLTSQSLKSTSLIPVLTPGAPNTAAVPIPQPDTPGTRICGGASIGKPSHTLPIAISQPRTPIVSRSPSVSMRNKTLSGHPKGCVRWSQSNLVHTSEQSGFQRNSVYNYSKPSSSQCIHAPPAARRSAASPISIPRASAMRIPRQATPSIDIPGASSSRIAQPETKIRGGVTPTANAFAIDRERFSRNGHNGNLPVFPSVPTEDFCAVFDDDEVVDNDEVVVEDDSSDEWEELDLPEPPSPIFIPTLQHSLYAA